MAACLWGGERAAISHRAAGTLWHLDGLAARRIEITVGREFDRRSSLVVVHRTTFMNASDVTDIGGIPVTSALRTLLDLAAVLRSDVLERALEDAFRRQVVTPDEVELELVRLGGPGRHGVAELRRLLDRRGAQSESGWEVRLRRVLVDHGLPAPVPQLQVTAGGRRLRLDLAYPNERVGVEFDSMRWHTGRDRLESDSERRNLLHAAGWRVVHVTARMLRERPEHVVGLVRGALRVDVSHEKRD